jgi:hypothetical protein
MALHSRNNRTPAIIVVEAALHKKQQKILTPNTEEPNWIFGPNKYFVSVLVCPDKKGKPTAHWGDPK